jgi:ferredoxin
MQQATSQHGGFTIRVLNKGDSFRCEPGQTLLAGMEKSRKQCINIGCRGGGCGFCKIRIIEGCFNCKRMSAAHISRKDSQAGLALACRVIPLSDMMIEADHCDSAVSFINNNQRKQP